MAKRARSTAVIKGLHDEVETLAQAVRGRDSELAELREQLNCMLSENRVLRAKLSGTNENLASPAEPGTAGRLRPLSSRDLLASLDAPGPTAIAAEYGNAPVSEEMALRQAKHGELPMWSQPPYEPDARMHTLAEVVRISARLQKLERMVRFLVERAG